MVSKSPYKARVVYRKMLTGILAGIPYEGTSHQVDRAHADRWIADMKEVNPSFEVIRIEVDDD